MNTKLIYILAKALADWRGLLKDPAKHWKEKDSAAQLATTWFNATGFPATVAGVFSSAGEPFASLEPLLILPEHPVPLPGGNRPLQSNAWVLARHASGLASIAVEGKVAEVLGPTMAEWQGESSNGRRKCLDFLKKTLGLHDDPPGLVRYQLLHRTASAVIEAHRFHAKTAIMLVHSLSDVDAGWEDLQSFVNLFGINPAPNHMVQIRQQEGLRVCVAWVAGRTSEPAIDIARGQGCA